MITAPYDYLSNGRRIEVKSAQLSWNVSSNRWGFKFFKVVSNNHDELLLVLYTPRGIYVYEYNGNIGLTCNGRGSTDFGQKNIEIWGRKYQEDWERALDRILQKDFGNLRILCIF